MTALPMKDAVRLLREHTLAEIALSNAEARGRGSKGAMKALLASTKKVLRALTGSAPTEHDLKVAAGYGAEVEAEE